jgi:hypothetical protein
MNRATRGVLICLVFLGGTTADIFTESGLAQSGAGEPIRVTTNEVLVPVVVIDEKRAKQLKKTDPLVLTLEAKGGDYHRWVDVAVLDLGAKDFHLFEDGREQQIRSVTLKPALLEHVQDNVGRHVEYIGTGGGKWTYPDLTDEPSIRVTISHPYYVMAYSRPTSPEGSCHHIAVKVDRAASQVTHRSEYCNNKFSTTDPLSGTKLGKKMEADLASERASKIALSMTAVALSAEASLARVHVVLEFPWKSLEYSSKGDKLYAQTGVLLWIYRQDGTLAERVSDLEIDESDRASGPVIPTRYENEIFLHPGHYRLQAALGDGAKLGQAEVALTINGQQDGQLAVSQIALGNRYRKARSEWAPTPGKLNWSYGPLVSNGVEITPTAETQFKNGEAFCFYFEVYNLPADGAPEESVDVHWRIADAQTGEAKKDVHSRKMGDTRINGPGMPIARQIDISDLPGGSYELEVQASDSVGRTTDWRTARFTVRASGAEPKSSRSPTRK